MASPLLIAKAGSTELALLPALANRHGLITGATGTGKSVTLQALAHRFSAAGVPVFMARRERRSLRHRQGRRCERESRRAAEGSESRSAFRSLSGSFWICSARAATRCARRSPTWGRCSSAACSG
jgi:hypothetical protein